MHKDLCIGTGLCEALNEHCSLRSAISIRFRSIPGGAS
jgi:hypothetical protein